MERQAAPEPDVMGLLQYAGLIVALSLLAAIHVPVPEGVKLP